MVIVAAKVYAKLFNNKKSSSCEQLTLRYSLDSGASPNPESRITLSSERDRLAQSVQLDWRLSPDKYTSDRAAIAQEFEHSGLGQLQIQFTNDTSWQSLRGSPSHRYHAHEYEPQTWCR